VNEKPVQLLWVGLAWRNLYGQLITGEVKEWYYHQTNYFNEKPAKT
jgi:hypothetical protein